jgi:hypothetical protein
MRLIQEEFRIALLIRAEMAIVGGSSFRFSIVDFCFFPFSLGDRPYRSANQAVRHSGDSWQAQPLPAMAKPAFTQNCQAMRSEAAHILTSKFSSENV